VSHIASQGQRPPAGLLHLLSCALQPFAVAGNQPDARAMRCEFVYHRTANTRARAGNHHHFSLIHIHRIFSPFANSRCGASGVCLQEGGGACPQNGSYELQTVVSSTAAALFPAIPGRPAALSWPSLL